MHARIIASRLGAIAAVLAAALAEPAVAEMQTAFTFLVPLRLQAIHHDVREIQVTCMVLTPSNEAKMYFHRISPGGGNHSVDLVLDIEADPEEEDLTRFTYWRCTLGFLGPEGVSYRTPFPNAEEDWLRVRPGAVVSLPVRAIPE